MSRRLIRISIIRISINKSKHDVGQDRLARGCTGGNTFCPSWYGKYCLEMKGFRRGSESDGNVSQVPRSEYARIYDVFRRLDAERRARHVFGVQSGLQVGTRRDWLAHGYSRVDRVDLPAACRAFDGQIWRQAGVHGALVFLRRADVSAVSRKQFPRVCAV